jgi:hypothetical protein
LKKPAAINAGRPRRNLKIKDPPPWDCSAASEDDSPQQQQEREKQEQEDLFMAEMRQIRKGITADTFAGIEFADEKSLAALDPDVAIIFGAVAHPGQAMEMDFRADGGAGPAVQLHFLPAI